MSRLINTAVFAFSVCILSFSAVGCGEETTVIEDTRPEAEIQAEEEAYEEQMEAADDVTQ